MSRLTWRDVAAPNFSSAIAGMRTAGDLIGNAFSGLDQSIQRFEGSKDDRVNKAFQLALAGFDNFDEFQAAKKADPSLGFDTNRLSLDSIGMLADRSTSLLDEDTAEFKLGADRFRFGEEQGKVNRAVESSDAIRAAGLAAAAGDDNKARELIAGSSLRGNEQLDVLSTIESLKKGQQGIRANDQTFNIREYGFDRTKLTDRQADQTNAAVAYAQSNFDTVEQASAWLRSQNLDPAVYNASSRAIGMPGLIQATDIAPVAGGSGSADALRVMNYEAADSGFSSVPASVQTLGQAVDFGRQVNRANQARMGTPGSSAMGVYQITRSTMEGYGKKIWGDDWQNRPFDFETQDTLARAIFEDHKGSAKALSEQWVSLTPGEAEQIRKMPWEQAREVIAQKESSSSPAALLRTMGDVTDLGRAAAFNEVNGNRMTDAFFEASDDTRNASQVAADLIENDPRYEGRNAVDIENEIEWVQARADKVARDNGLPTRRVSPALAAEILSQSEGPESVWNNIRGIFGAGWSERDGDGWFSDRAVSEDKIDQNLLTILDGGIEREERARRDIGRSQADEAVILGQIQNAKIMADQVSRRGGNPQPYLNRVAELEQQLLGFQASEANSPRVVLPGAREAAPTVPGKPQSRRDLVSRRDGQPATAPSFSEQLRSLAPSPRGRVSTAPRSGGGRTLAEELLRQSALSR